MALDHGRLIRAGKNPAEFLRWTSLLANTEIWAPVNHPFMPF